MADFKGKVKGFKRPTDLPESSDQQVEWNAANKKWWEQHPMRYDFSESLSTDEEFSKQFFDEIDRRFFESSREFSPFRDLPFERIIDYNFIKGKSVLEIGVGNGSHAQLLAANCGRYIGIDLTQYGVRSTTQRLKHAGILNAEVYEMNAEKMTFPDSSFDYIWSWGVIHHSANTLQILQEMRRVLKEDGKSTVMVYYRSHWYKYIYAGFFHGLLKGYFRHKMTLDDVVQRTIDGAIARFYRIGEWKRLVAKAGLEVSNIRVMGNKSSVIILPYSGIKKLLVRLMPGALSRFLTSRLRMGYFLVADLKIVD